MDKDAYRQWRKSAEEVEAIVSDASIPRWEKTHRVGKAYTKLDLHGLQSKHRHKILSGFGKINAILARYTLNSFDDYDKIEDADQREIIRIVRSLSPTK